MEVKIDVPFPELRKAIVALNESQILATVDQDTLKEIGVIGNKIKLVAVSRENMLSTFMSAFDMIKDNEEGKCPAPKEALDFYNMIIDLENKTKETVAEKSATSVNLVDVKATPSVVVDADKVQEKPKIVNPKVEKASSDGKTPTNRSQAGSASYIHELFAKGLSKKEALAVAIKQYPIMATGPHFESRWSSAGKKGKK